MGNRRLLFGVFFCFALALYAQEVEGENNTREINEIIAPDSLAYAKKYSPRVQRLIENPLTPSKAAFLSIY